MNDTKIVGTCPECGDPVFEQNEYRYDSQSDTYWHFGCLPKSDEGFQ